MTRDKYWHGQEEEGILVYYWCYSHHGKQYGSSSKEKKLPYDSAIPLLSLYPQEKNHDLKEISVPYVHCSIIHNNQGMDTS